MGGEGPQDGKRHAQAAGAELRLWRAQIIGGLTLATASALAVAVLLAFALDIFHGPSGWLLVPLAISWVAVLSSHAERLGWPALGMSFEWQTRLLIVALLSTATISIGGIGMGPNVFLGFLLAILIATIMLGWREAVVTFACTVGITLLGARLFDQQAFERPRIWWPAFEITDPAILGRMVVIYGFLTFAIMLSVWRLLSHTELQLLAKARSLDALEREQAEKEGLRVQLVERDAAYRRAQEVELLGRLAAYAAHDFNNSLTVIQASVSELREVGAASTEILELLGMIDGAATQAAATSRQLRSFGSAPADDVVLDIDAIVERTAVMLRKILPAAVVLSVEIEKRCQIRADESEVQRVLTNLALNARDAMPEGGALRFVVRTPEGDELSRLDKASTFLAVDVIDTGAGMDTATLGRVFQPFFTTKGEHGTGLGLSSVRELLERRGGTVTVRSTPGAGTHFSLFWPVANP